jgi:U4/U6.U5 tri-snRNP-associated protein 3
VKLDGQKKPAVEAKEKEEEGEDEEEDDTAAQMARMMGFSSFDSSKGKKGVDVGSVARTKTSSFRQYMNRDKGFNRELSPPPAERRRK